jgi:hypothetical protein
MVYAKARLCKIITHTIIHTTWKVQAEFADLCLNVSVAPGSFFLDILSVLSAM